MPNLMAGWAFSEPKIQESISCDRLLNPSIDLSNPCNLNCPYCFVEEKDSERKLRFPDELSLEETLGILHDLASAGAKTVNIVGAGEPTIDRYFKRVIREIMQCSMTPVVFTNGIRLSEHLDLVDFLYECNAMQQLKAEFETKFQESRQSYEAIMEQLAAAVGLTFDLWHYVPRDERRAVIDKMDDGFLKDSLIKNIDKINSIIPHYMDKKIEAFFAALGNFEVVASTNKLTFGWDTPRDSKENKGDETNVK